MAEPDHTNYVGDDVSAAQSVGSAAQNAGSAVHHMGTDAIAKATDTIHHAQSRVSDLGTDLGDRVESLADEQKDGVAERLDGVADALRRSGEALQDKEEWLARLIERGADEMTGFAKTLRSNDLGVLLSDVQNLARRQPALFMGTSLAAGFALARVGRVAVTAPGQEVKPGSAEVPK